MDEKKQSDLKKILELRGQFIGRAKQYLVTNPHARQKLAKSFGKSVEKSSTEELSYLFEVLIDEIYEKEHLNYKLNEKLNAYFFVLTMMSYYWKTLEEDDAVRMELVLNELFHHSTDSTKKKIRTLIGDSFGSSGTFQARLASITKQIHNMTNIDYFSLLNDLCSWNYCNGQSNVSITCYNWSKIIFLKTEEENL